MDCLVVAFFSHCRIVVQEDALRNTQLLQCEKNVSALTICNVGKDALSRHGALLSTRAIFSCIHTHFRLSLGFVKFGALFSNLGRSRHTSRDF